MILLKSDVMRKLLRREYPALYVATRLVAEHTRDGLESLITFIRITRAAVETADSALAARIALARLLALFEAGRLDQAVVDQPIVDQVIDDYPDFGLAWEAWCVLEDEFEIPRDYALEFIRGLEIEAKHDAEGTLPESQEDLLRFTYATGGVVGLIAANILKSEVLRNAHDDTSRFQQAFVDAGTAARLATLARHRSDRTNNLRFEGVNNLRFESANNLRLYSDIFFLSARDAFAKLRYPSRIALALVLTTHREAGRSRWRIADRIFDEFVRQSGSALWNWLRRQEPVQKPKHEELTRPPLGARDKAMTVRTQATLLRARLPASIREEGLSQ